MPHFPSEPQAGSSRQHYQEHEYAKLGAEWLSQSYLSRMEGDSNPTHPTPSHLTQNPIPPPTLQEPITPVPLPTDHDEDDWELQMLHMVRKAQETEKGTAAKNKELLRQNEELQKENHNLHLLQ